MKPTKFILVSLWSLLLLGCPIRPKQSGSAPDGGGGDVVDTRPGPDGGDAADAADGAPTADASDAQEVVVSLPTLTLTSPANGTHTNGTLQITVGVANGDAPPNSITLLENGAMIATVSAPYQYAWDTTSLPEGTYSLVAQVTVGGRVATSTPVNVVVDRTPPSIVMLTPMAGTSGVILTSPIGATFSEPILPASFPAGAIALSAGAKAVAATATLSTDGTTATVKLTDTSTLTLPQSFSATFASTITDLAGNKLTQPITPWQWNVPDWIKTAMITGYASPLIRIDPKGLPFVQYATEAQQGSVFSYNVSLARYDGQAWSDLALPTSATNTSIQGFSFDLNAAGNPTAAWVESSANGSRIHVASFDGTQWKPLPPLDAVMAAGTNATLPVVRLDSKGVPLVAWKEDTASGNDIFVARWNGPGVSGWDLSYGPLGFSGVALVYGVDLILGPNDSPVVGWYTASGMGVATHGINWTLSTDSRSSAGPSVGIDAAGKPVLVVRNGNTSVQVYTGTEWDAEPLLPAPASSTSAQDQVLVMTSTHNPVVAWLDTTGPNRLGLSRWNGTKWDARPGLFHANGTLDLVGPSVAVDLQDHMWIAWVESGQVNVWMSNY